MSSTTRSRRATTRVPSAVGRRESLAWTIALGGLLSAKPRVALANERYARINERTNERTNDDDDDDDVAARVAKSHQDARCVEAGLLDALAKRKRRVD